MRGSKEEKPAYGEYISIGEAAKRYPPKKDWYYRHINRGTLPFRLYPLMEGKSFVKVAEIEAWIERCAVPVTKGVPMK
jgi:predicted DNA-binding transcriptional regulator AlpA